MIEIINIKKSFSGKVITDNLSLNVRDGEFLAIIGRSGSGKSVLLKQIIGLLDPDVGSILIDEQDITKLSKKYRQKIFKKCGYVFQFAALLDSLTVLENVGIKLFETRESHTKIKSLVIDKLQAVGLDKDVIDKYPSELSGGMKKRVGLARTLMLDPKIILYDEPTTGLDPITAKIIHELILETHRKQNAITVVISHDVDVFKFATDVAMLYEGKIIYKGVAEEIWQSKNQYVYQFIRGLSSGPIQ